MGFMQRTVGFAQAADVNGFAPIARPTLTADERRQRADAARFAVASVGLEGFQLSPEAQAHIQRFVDGEIDLPELVRGR